MAVLPPGSEPLSYSARLCRRCGESLVKQRGLLGRDSWRCEQCRARAARSGRH